MLAIGIVNWAGFARIMRAEVLLAARARVRRGRPRARHRRPRRSSWRHICPNVCGTVLVMGSYYVALAIIAEAGFSFIGMGAQPPTPSLGQMIADGRNYFYVELWPAIVPGVDDRADRARPEPARRRAARHLRPAAAALLIVRAGRRREPRSAPDAEPRLLGRGPARRDPRAPRPVDAVDDVSLRRRAAARSLGLVGRERLRQDA